MNIKKLAINFFPLLALCLSFINNAQSQTDGIITKKQVLQFVETKRNSIMEYKCASDDTAQCKVECSSGGNDYIKAENALKAFHYERRSSINGNIVSYYLVVDVKDTSGNKDVWATLQIESSCTFIGMKPLL